MPCAMSMASAGPPLPLCVRGRVRLSDSTVRIRSDKGTSIHAAAAAAAAADAAGASDDDPARILSSSHSKSKGSVGSPAGATSKIQTRLFLSTYTSMAYAAPSTSSSWNRWHSATAAPSSSSKKSAIVCAIVSRSFNKNS